MITRTLKTLLALAALAAASGCRAGLGNLFDVW